MKVEINHLTKVIQGNVVLDISMPVFPVLPAKTGDGFTGFKESMEVAKPCLLKGFLLYYLI